MIEKGKPVVVTPVGNGFMVSPEGEAESTGDVLVAETLDSLFRLLGEHFTDSYPLSLERIR